jgi:hypothetical protein
LLSLLNLESKNVGYSNIVQHCKYLLTDMPRFLHQVFGDAVQFAPLGLINMFNSGGALEDISSISDSSATTIHVRCRGPGRFGAYSATRPELCRVDGQQVEFSHTEDGLLAFEIPCSSSRDGDLWRIEILYRTS